MSDFDDLDPVEEARIRRGIKRMAFATWLLDDCFRLPGTERRFGLDGLVGLVPGAGDVLMGVFQMYLLVEAGSLGVARKTLRRMLTNVVLDTTIGCVPIAGDLFDFVFKSSTRNLALATADLAEHHDLDGPLEPPVEAPEPTDPAPTEAAREELQEEPAPARP